MCFPAVPAARATDIDELWRFAARKVRADPNPPQDVYVDGLRCLASALETPGRYDESALRLLQRELFVRILADLSISRDVAARPEISQIPVRRPLLIAGFGRTGSTLLHNLLALDPVARAPLLWELWMPSPPPHPDTAASDPRIESTQIVRSHRHSFVQLRRCAPTTQAAKARRVHHQLVDCFSAIQSLVLPVSPPTPGPASPACRDGAHRAVPARSSRRS